MRAEIRRARGFTLLEILIALLVLALALVALSRTCAVQVQAFSDLRERTLAGWLAADILAETRLAATLPAPGRSNGQRRFAGRDWRWELEVQNTQAPSVRRLDVHVASTAAPTTTLAQLTGFGGTDLTH